MRISHAFRFVFLSKHKCASTAIRRALDPVSDIKSTQLRPYYHHATLADVEQQFRIEGRDLGDYFVFTSVRDPVALLRSLYDYGAPDRDGAYWWERRWDEVSREVVVPKTERAAADPVPFRTWILEHDLSRFTLDPFIRDASGAVRIDKVLHAETLADEFPNLTEQLGLGRLQAPAVNVGPGRTHEFDAPMLDRVRQLFRTDIEVGGYRV